MENQTSDFATNPITEIERLREERQRYISKTFILVLEILVIFAVPALLGYLAGFFWGEVYWKILLPVAFVTSWIIVIRIYIKINKDLTDIDRQIEELQKRMKVQ